MFFEVGEIVFDGMIEVRAVGREEKDVMPLVLSNSFQIFLFVEDGVSKDQGGVGMQFLDEHGFGPVVHQVGVSGARKQQRGQKTSAASGGDQAHTRPFFAGTLAMDFLAPQAPAIAAIGARFKARFININQVFPAVLFDNLT